MARQRTRKAIARHVKEALTAEIWRLGEGESAGMFLLAGEQNCARSIPTTRMSTQQQAQRGDEIFDVVNERDEVVGQATRREVHGKGLLHRAVHVLAFNRRGQVFLQKRSMAKDSAPGCWDSSCSGHLDAGEDYPAAAVRELEEEIGLRIAGPHLLTPVFRSVACADTANEFVWVYRLDSEGPFVLNPAEIDRGEWFEPADVSKAVVERPVEFARCFRYIWRGFLAAQSGNGPRR